MPEIVRAAAESFKHVDNLTILNGAQGVSEIIAQVIGQAGPALDMAQNALKRTPLNGESPPMSRRLTVLRELVRRTPRWPVRRGSPSLGSSVTDSRG